MILEGVPHLFSMTDSSGIPAEFDEFLRTIGGHAVAKMSKRLIADIRRDRKSFADSKGYQPKLTSHQRGWIFLLHAYCARNKEPAPPELLWLTFESFGLKEGEPDSRLSKEVGAITGVNELHKFYEASCTEGRYIARGSPPPSNKRLAYIIDIAPSTLRRWRTMAAYKANRDRTARTYGWRWKDLTSPSLERQRQS